MYHVLTPPLRLKRSSLCVSQVPLITVHEKESGITAIAANSDSDNAELEV